MTRVIAGHGRRDAAWPSRRATGTRPTSTGPARACFSTWQSLARRPPGRRAGPRPVRGLRRRRSGGALARRRPRPARRGGRPCRPHGPGERLGPRPARRRGQGGQSGTDHPHAGPGRAVRPRLPRPALRRLGRRSSRDPAHTRVRRGGSATEALVTVERSTSGGEFRLAARLRSDPGPVATARERFGTVAPPLRAKTHDDRTGERGITKCAVPSVPGRSTRSPTDTSTSSPGPPACTTRSYVAVMINQSKKGLFEIEERIDLIRAGHRRVRQRRASSPFHGLLVDFCKRARHPGHRQGPARGQRLRLRAADGPDEQRPLRRRDPVRARPTRSTASCPRALVKEVATWGGDVAHLVPPVVLEALTERLAAGLTARPGT